MSAAPGLVKPSKYLEASKLLRRHVADTRHDSAGETAVAGAVVRQHCPEDCGYTKGTSPWRAMTRCMAIKTVLDLGAYCQASPLATSRSPSAIGLTPRRSPTCVHSIGLTRQEQVHGNNEWVEPVNREIGSAQRTIMTAISGAFHTGGSTSIM